MKTKINSRITKVHFIYASIILISLLATVILLFIDEVVEGYEFLWVLPLAFSIVSTFSIRIINNLHKNIAVFILWGGYFIRYVLTPLFLGLGNYKLVFSLLLSTSIEKAILLMFYEIIFVSIVINIYLGKNQNQNLSEFNKVQFIKGSKFNSFLLLGITLLLVIIVMIVPEIRDSFTTIFSGGNKIATVDYDIGSIAVRGTFKRILSTLFVFVFNVIRYIIPVFLIELVYKRMKISYTSYLISSLISILPFMFITGSSVQPFLSLLINVIMMLKLYPKPTKKLAKIYILMGGVILIIVLGSKLELLSGARGVTGMASIGLTLNAYFPGVGNVAAAFSIPKDLRVVTFIYDVFSTIPFRYSFFPGIASNEVTLSELFRIYSGRGNQIVPVISGANYYIGSIFAPILPAVTSLLSIKMKNIADNTKSYWYYFYFLFFSIQTAMIPNMYTHNSLLQVSINIFLPLYIIIRISHGKNSRV